MDLGRGSLVFPQLWGDLSLLDDKDVAFLASVQSMVKRNEATLLQKRWSFGDPWKNEVYGWAYTKGSRGFVFINNIHFESRKVQLDLGFSLGLEVERGTALGIYSHFPERNTIRQKDGSEFRAGDRADLWLRPFEVLMLEIGTADTAVNPAPSRQIDAAPNLGIRLPLTPMPLPAGMNIEFADAGRFEKEGKKKQVTAFTTELPALDGYPPILAVTVRLR